MTAPEDFRALQIGQGDLWEGLRVKGTWFHVLRSFSHEGEIARIGTMALAVYIVIKGHTDFQTGSAWPGVKEIAKQIGVSDDTVETALKVLVEHGWLEVTKQRGRRNNYTVVEKIQLESLDGRPWATAERAYAGKEFGGFVSELERLAKTGNLPTDRAITINLTVNVQNNIMGDNSTAIQNDYRGVDRRKS